MRNRETKGTNGCLKNGFWPPSYREFPGFFGSFHSEISWLTSNVPNWSMAIAMPSAVTLHAIIPKIGRNKMAKNGKNPKIAIVIYGFVMSSDLIIFKISVNFSGCRLFSFFCSFVGEISDFVSDVSIYYILRNLSKYIFVRNFFH